MPAGSVFKTYLDNYARQHGGVLPRTQGMMADRALANQQYQFGENLDLQKAQMSESRRQFEEQQRHALLASLIGGGISGALSLGGAALTGGMSMVGSKALQAALAGAGGGGGGGSNAVTPSPYDSYFGNPFQLTPPKASWY